MKAGWGDLRSRAADQAVLRARQSQRDARPRERMDAVLATIVALGVGLCAAAGLFAARAVDRSGLADPPVLRPLPDPRILENLRDSNADFVGGTMLGSGRGDLLVLREDGQVTEYDPRTGVLATSALPALGGANGLETGPVAVGSGCGLLLGAGPGGGPECARPDSVHVLSERGGVLRRDGARWRVLLHDGAWIGQAGTPVQQDDVTAWAASADGRFVAVLAGLQGLAIFDNRTGRWTVPDDQAPLPAAAEAGPVQMVPDGDAFWLASRRGLGRLSARAAQTGLVWSTDRQMAFLDLVVTPDGQAMALTEGPCAEPGGGADCLTVVDIDGVDRLDLRIGDRQRVPDLDQASVQHAAIQNGALVTLGQSGIHSYDPDLRSWSPIFPGRIDAFDAGPDGRIAAVQGGTVVVVADAAIVARRDAQGGPFRQIALAAPLAYGLGQDGILRDLATDDILHGDGDGLPQTAAFATGAAFGDLVLLAGPEGALLHDVLRRRMTWMPAAGLGAAVVVTRAGTRILAAHGRFWAVEPGRGHIHALDIGGAYPNQALTAQRIGQIAAPLASVTATQQGLTMVDAGGRPWAVDAAGTLFASVGEGRQFGRFAPTMAADFDGGLVFADPTAIWSYRRPERAWEGPFPLPPGGALRDVAVGDGLFALMADGGVHRGDGATGYAPVLVGGAAALGLADVTDAAAVGPDVLLAGRGAVQAYDPVVGRFERRWQGGSGAVRLVAPSQGAPVWLSSGRLLRGDARMTDRPIRGAWQVPDGILAEAERPGGANYTMHFRDGADPVCRFLGAEPPEGAVIDAVGLGDGRVLVATARGTAIHDPENRRWIAVASRALTQDARLHIAGGSLLAVGRQSFRAIPLADIPSPDSCDDPEARLEWAIDRPARAVAFDAAGGQVAVLETDGAVRIWADGAFRPLIGAPTPGPDLGAALGIAATPGAVLVATPQAIWRYVAASRVWRSIRYDVPGDGGLARITEVDLRPVEDGRLTATVWTADGGSFGGTMGPADAALVLTRLRGVTLPRIPIPPSQIRDIARSGQIWAVASDTAMAFGPGDADRLDGALAIVPGLEPTLFDWGDTVAFLKGPVEAPEAVWILPPDTDLATLGGSLDARAFRYEPGTDRAYGVEPGAATLWRIARDGALLRCPIQAGLTARDGCRTALAAPDSLDPDALLSAVEEGDGFLLIARGGVLVLDRSYRNLQRIAGPVTDADSRFLRWNGGIYLLERWGGALWRIDGAAARRVADGVLALARHRSAILAQTDRGTVALGQGDAIPVPDLPPDSRAMTFDWFGEPGFTGLDPLGRPVDGQGATRSALALPRASRVAAILPETGNRAFWVLDGAGMLDRLAPATCVAGPPTGGGQVRCLRSTLPRRIDAADLGRMLGWVGRPGGAGRLIFAEGVLAIDAAGRASAEATLPERRLGTLAPALATSRIRDLIVRSPDGVPEIAPPRLSGGALRAPRLDRVVVPAPTRWGALDLDWMRWDRQAPGFVFDGAGGPVPLTAAEAIRDGTIIAAGDGVAAFGVPGAGRHAWLTGDALWHLDPGRAGPILVSVQRSARPVGLLDGRFVLPDGGTLAANDGTAATGPSLRRETLGDMTLTEAGRGNVVTARLRRSDGSDVSVAAARGWLLDDRQGIGFLGARPVLSTPVGLVPASGPITEVAPGPDGAPPRRIVSRAAERYAEAEGGAWLRQAGPGRWAPVSDPFASRVLARESGLEWSIDPTGLDLRPLTEGDAWRADRAGLDFAADRFVSVAGDTATVLLGTGLGTHALGAAGDLSRPGPVVDAAAPQAPFDALAVTPGRSVLFDGAGARQVWDAQAARWRPPAATGEAPWQDRRPLDTAALRLEIAAGHARVWRRVTGTAGQARWAGFAWSPGEMMPFDNATAIWAGPDALWIGTAFGLRRFGVQGRPSSDLFDVAGATGDAPAAAVTRLGRPAGDPTRAMATTEDGGCVDLTPGGALSPCADAGSLATRFVVQDDLWRWTRTDAEIDGTYPALDGSDVAARLGPTGHWPHDALRAWGDCAGRRLELWSEGDTLREAGVTRRLPDRADGLWCQAEGAALGGGAALAEGLYLTGPQVLAAGPGGTWQPVPQPQADAVRRRHGGQVLYEAQRMRIVAGPARGAFQHRTAADTWRSLGWEGDRLAIDRTLGFATAGTGVARVTPSGVVTQAAGSPLRLDPDGLQIETADAFGAFDGCTISEIERDPAGAPGGGLQFRCADGRSFAQTAAGGDIGAYTVLPDDPFASRILIDSDPWRWTRTRPDPARPPVIEATFQGEPAVISAGRFGMDTLTGLAAATPGRLDLVATDGWRVHPMRRLGAVHGARPTRVPDPQAVTALTVDRTEAGEVLCVTTDRGAVTLGADGRPRRVETCARWRGADGFWTYRDVLGAGPAASGIAANGPRLARRIEEGRFRDLVATGLPRDSGGAVAVPTADGVLLVDPDTGPRTIHSIEGAAGLFPDAAGRPVAATPAGPIVLDGAEGGAFVCAPLGALLRSAGEAVSVQTLDRRGGLVRMTGRVGAGQPVSLTADCVSGTVHPLRDEIGVGDRVRHAAQLRHLGDATRTLRLEATAQGLVLSDGRSRSVPLPIGGIGAPLAIFGIDQGRSMLAVFERQVLSLDVDAALSLLGRTAVAPTAEAAPPDAPGLPDGAAPPEVPDRPAPGVPEPVPPRDPPTGAQADAPQVDPIPDIEVPFDGMTPGEIRAIQSALRELGHYRLAVDGRTGPGTRAAVRRYQASLGAPQTAVLTRVQRTRLLQGTP